MGNCIINRRGGSSIKLPKIFAYPSKNALMSDAGCPEYTFGIVSTLSVGNVYFADYGALGVFGENSLVQGDVVVRLNDDRYLYDDVLVNVDEDLSIRIRGIYQVQSDGFNKVEAYMFDGTEWIIVGSEKKFPKVISASSVSDFPSTSVDVITDTSSNLICNQTFGIISDIPVNSVYNSIPIGDEQEGDVYLDLFTESKQRVNLIGNIFGYANPIQQYQNGEWKQVETWIVGIFDGWTKVLMNIMAYNSGDECIDVTGGWEGTVGTLTKNVDSMKLTGTNGVTSHASTVNAIDLTDISYIEFKVSTSGSNPSYVGVTSTKNLYPSGNSIRVNVPTGVSGTQIVTVDVSAISGLEYYLQFSTDAFNAGLYVYSVRLVV